MSLGTSEQATELGERYLGLMKQCLTRYLFVDEQFTEVPLTGWRARAWGPFRRVLAGRGIALARMGGDREARLVGRDWPPHAETMVGLRRLDNLQHCVVDVVRRDVPGDVIEAGVWRGGASIFMRAVLAATGDTNRRVWVADSFRGLPTPEMIRYPADRGVDVSDPCLSVTLDQVKANFAKYGLLDDQVRFLPGWFRDSLPTAPLGPLAVVRLDGDLYESTIDAISVLYPKLSVGGYLIVDDYNALEPCRQAITDYRAAHGITEEMETVDWTCVFWRKLR